MKKRASLAGAILNPRRCAVILGLVLDAARETGARRTAGPRLAASAWQHRCSFAGADARQSGVPRVLTDMAGGEHAHFCAADGAVRKLTAILL